MIFPAKLVVRVVDLYFEAEKGLRRLIRVYCLGYPSFSALADRSHLQAAVKGIPCPFRARMETSILPTLL